MKCSETLVTAWSKHNVLMQYTIIFYVSVEKETLGNDVLKRAFDFNFKHKVFESFTCNQITNKKRKHYDMSTLTNFN